MPHISSERCISLNTIYAPPTPRVKGVGNPFPGIEFPDPALDFYQEDQPLDRVLYARIRWQLPNRLQDPFLRSTG